MDAFGHVETDFPPPEVFVLTMSGSSVLAGGVLVVARRVGDVVYVLRVLFVSVSTLTGRLGCYPTGFWQRDVEG